MCFVSTFLVRCPCGTSLRERCTSLATNLLQAIAGKAHERGILDEAAGEERLPNAFRNKGNGRREGGLSRMSVGKVKVKSIKKLELSSFPGYEEEVLFLIFNLLCQVPQISIFPSSRSQLCSI